MPVFYFLPGKLLPSSSFHLQWYKPNFLLAMYFVVKCILKINARKIELKIEFIENDCSTHIWCTLKERCLVHSAQHTKRIDSETWHCWSGEKWVRSPQTHNARHITPRFSFTTILPPWLCVCISRKIMEIEDHISHLLFMCTALVPLNFLTGCAWNFQFKI